MKVLIVGSGGREHALGWKIAQSPRHPQLYFAPGNGGTLSLGENVPLKADDIHGIAVFARSKKIDLVIVGPDNALAAGLVDKLSSYGVLAFGPTIMAAQIEASKAYSKLLMQQAGIRTAPFAIFDDYDKANAYVQKCHAPMVVKADGLALGKGVHVCKTRSQACAAVRESMLEDRVGIAGHALVIEDYLDGPEFSAHVMCGKDRVELFPFSQDYKYAQDGDKGPMTGGMGVVAPMPMLLPYAEEVGNIIKATMSMFESRGIHFNGCLYPGFKIAPNGLNVLEYNARFGDPECQAYMRLMEDDLLEVILGFIDGSYKSRIRWWNAGFVATVVVAAEGYPDTLRTGDLIEGIREASRVPGVEIFHAGTRLERGSYYTAGGRVLHVTAVGVTFKQALERAYEAVGCIDFPGMHFRRDIGSNVPEPVQV